MGKSKDGVFKICRYELVVRIALLRPAHIPKVTNCAAERARSAAYPHAVELTHRCISVTVTYNVSGLRASHVSIISNVLEWNEQTVGYEMWTVPYFVFLIACSCVRASASF